MLTNKKAEGYIETAIKMIIAVVITENVTVYVLSVVTERKTIDEIADFYGFNSYQKEKLSNLLANRTAELWDYTY